MTSPLNKATKPLEEAQLKNSFKEVTDKEVTVAGRVWKELKEGINLLIRSIKKGDWVFAEPKMNEKMKTNMLTLKKNIENLHSELIKARKQASFPREVNKDAESELKFLETDAAVTNIVINQCLTVQEFLKKFTQNKLDKENKAVLSDLKAILEEEITADTDHINQIKLDQHSIELDLLKQKVEKEYAEMPGKIKKALSNISDSLEKYHPGKRFENNVFEGQKAFTELEKLKDLVKNMQLKDFSDPSDIKKEMEKYNKIINTLLPKLEPIEYFGFVGMPLPRKQLGTLLELPKLMKEFENLQVRKQELEKEA